ncbi:MAG: hypothetical protein ACOWWH_11265 [Eubacteriaceae bacterium]
MNKKIFYGLLTCVAISFAIGYMLWQDHSITLSPKLNNLTEEFINNENSNYSNKEQLINDDDSDLEINIDESNENIENSDTMQNNCINEKTSKRNPEVIETMNIVIDELEDVKHSIDDTKQEEFISMLQESLNSAKDANYSIDKDVSSLSSVYETFTDSQKRKIQSSIMSKVNIRYLLFLKETFGLY